MSSANMSSANMSSTNRAIPCLSIGGEEFCNVTLNWTPRVSLVGGIFAMVVPTVFALACVIYHFFDVKQEDGVNVAEETLKSYKINKRLIYLKDHVTKEDYEGLKTNDDNRALDRGHNRYNKFQINGEETTLPDPLDEGGCSPRESHVSPSRFETARKYRKTCFGKLTLTRPCGLMVMIWTLTLQPITVIVWGIVDVLADTFYFYQLERGHLLDSTITRNVHVNNGILVFAVLGAIMASYGGYCYFIVLLMNEDKGSLNDRAKVINWTIRAAGCKIVFEDAPEMILEYFYVDKYIVEYQPWYLIMKDVITAVIYALPLIKYVKKVIKKTDYPDHKILEKIYGNDHVFMYIYVTSARVMMSLAMTFRIVGMIIQYTSGTIDQDCLEVTDGKLIQTPFTIGCLNWCDWCVLSSLCVLLFNVFIPIFPFLLSEYIG